MAIANDDNDPSKAVQIATQFVKDSSILAVVGDYDATRAIIEGFKQGLKQSNTRDELQRVLRSPNFSADGTTGKIQFLPSGDRRDNPIFLVKVQRKPGTDTYEYVPIIP